MEASAFRDAARRHVRGGSSGLLGAAVLVVLALVLFLQGSAWCSWTRHSRSHSLHGGQSSMVDLRHLQGGQVGSVIVDFEGFNMTLVALWNE